MADGLNRILELPVVMTASNELVVTVVSSTPATGATVGAPGPLASLPVAVNASHALMVVFA